MQIFMSHQIHITGCTNKMDIQSMTSYLCQAVLKLRDRNNQQQAIELLGTAGAIPICILIAEIITKNSPRLSQITYFQQQNKTEDQEFHSIGIKIRLTYRPTEDEMRQPGYQKKEVDSIKQNNWDDLYQFVMMYSNDLSIFKKHEQKRQLSNTKQINQISSQSLHHTAESYVIKNIDDSNSFVYTCNHDIDNVNRSKIKTRGQKRK